MFCLNMRHCRISFPKNVRIWSLIGSTRSILSCSGMDRTYVWIQRSIESDATLAGDLYVDQHQRYPFWEGVRDLKRLPWGWDVVPLDVDADGWMDVAFNGNACAAPMAIVGTLENGAGPGGLLINQEGMGFVDHIWDAGIANVDSEGLFQDGRSIATGDLNNDGYPDLVFANRSYNPSDTNPLEQKVGTPQVWLSQSRENNWLQVRLQGVQSNREGIGAKVMVDIGDRKIGAMDARKWKTWFFR